MSKLALAVMLASACAARSPAVMASHASSQLERSTLRAEGLDPRRFLDLAIWVRDHPVPIYSLLVSHDGKLVFELYTGSIDPDAAHYLMSVTKSVVSMLIGIATERGLVPSPETSIADALPAQAFASAQDRERFRAVTIKNVLEMSALDTPDPPRVETPEAIARQRAFLAARDRLRFALAQPILARPGMTFLYNDIGPTLATGLLAAGTRMRVLRFAEDNLFGPLGFRNYEWMHRDASGLDNGGYGLRLRPIDLHALGVLYLHAGKWRDRQLVPAAWVETSFAPLLRSGKHDYLDYGWYWWAESFGPGWVAHEAVGWKGQRILVFPEHELVVTMTGYFEHGADREVVAHIIRDFIAPSAQGGPVAGSDVDAMLDAVLAEVHRGRLRGPAHPQPRMVPSVAPKE
jgi:CubicO group peptidase (beta-lactamase class C family)